MKKLLLSTFLLSFLTIIGYGQELKIDTLYFSNEGKLMKIKTFADYYRIKIDSEGIFRDFYISGQIKAKGSYSVDPLDNSVQILDGAYTSYYTNGQEQRVCTYQKGKLAGELVEYNQDGSLVRCLNYDNGLLEGISSEFITQDKVKHQEYNNGIALSYYYIEDDKGCIMKVNAASGKAIWESPTWSERQTEFKDGELWNYYNKNGLTIVAANSVIKDYGKYYMIRLVIANNSFEDIDFAPELNVQASVLSRSGETSQSTVLSSYDYMKIVKRKQNWETALLAFSESMSASNAGYSQSTTTSLRTGTTYTTTSYNYAAAHQARAAASNRIANLMSSQAHERSIREEGYIKRTTIHPADAISGYFLINKSYSDQMVNVVININGADYTFVWEMENKTNNTSHKTSKDTTSNNGTHSLALSYDLRKFNGLKMNGNTLSYLFTIYGKQDSMVKFAMSVGAGVTLSHADENYPEYYINEIVGSLDLTEHYLLATINPIINFGAAIFLGKRKQISVMPYLGIQPSFNCYSRWWLHDQTTIYSKYNFIEEGVHGDVLLNAQAGIRLNAKKALLGFEFNRNLMGYRSEDKVYWFSFTGGYTF